MIGAQNFFRTEDAALDAIYQWVNDPTFNAKFCPLSLAPSGESGTMSLFTAEDAKDSR